jgi:hypothetical protein
MTTAVVLGGWVVASVVTMVSAQAPPTTAQSPMTFAKDIQPVLERSCWTCHSADLQRSKLDLSSREAALKGGEHGAAIVPGNAEQSKLYRMVAGLDEPAMPTDGQPLTPAQIAAIKTWIDQGARWEPVISFAKSVQPLFESSCWNCHGASLQLSKFDLRTRESALRGGEHGSDIVPGNAEQSRMYRRIAGLETPAMPMEGTPPTPAQVAAVKAWIDQGAKWDVVTTSEVKAPPANALAALEQMELTPDQRNYWFFKLPVQAPVPSHPTLENPIDRFVEAARRERGLKAAPRASRSTLVRRAYLDLIGLPPTPAQVAEFMADTSPKAWPRLIDKLLASPHYGERYGRHWLDVARYADTDGYEFDYDRPNAWRYRDYVIRSFNEDKPYTTFVKEQIAGDELDWVTEDSLIATGFMRAGPRVHQREKDNPERRYDYLDDMVSTIGRGMLGLTVGCARCHHHKFDPISQKDYYSLVTDVYGYVELEVPLTPRAEADAYTKANADIDAKQAARRAQISKIEEPIRRKLQIEQIKAKYPENVQRAVFKPEAERTPGERLIATQVLAARGTISPAEIEKQLTPEEIAKRKALTEQIAALDKQRPEPLPMAEIITDGDWRFAPNGRGDDVIGCPKCRLPPPEKPNGTFLPRDGEEYEPPPSYFLIKGDPQSRGSLLKPGFIATAIYGNPPTEIPRSTKRTSGRRLALAAWIASSQNPFTARVIVNRMWQAHFGRGIVASLDNFGKMGEPPTHQALLDWLAVQFMNDGWSLKQLHRLIMSSETYQMASAYEDGADMQKDPENLYLWRFRTQRLDAEIVRDSMLAVGGNLNPDMYGKPVFPFVPKEVLDSELHAGKWDTMKEGPETWRRSIYVYQRRSLPFPMFNTFDHPDMITTVGARTVSTVPTQALTLLNNSFVLQQAQKLAGVVKQQASDPYTQINLAYQIALGRPATEKEIPVGINLTTKYSLVGLTHVILNLNEFMYMR